MIDDSCESDLRGEDANFRARTPPMKRGGHVLDDDACCIHCGFDAAEHHHWRHSTYEGRAAAMAGNADEPPCQRRVDR